MNKWRIGAGAMATGLALSMAGVGTASAEPSSHVGVCSGGPVSGTYSNLRITGQCMVPDGATLRVEHNLTVARGAMFDAMTHSEVHIGGNVKAEPGSLFGLGCTPAHPCDGNESQDFSTHDTVDGNVILDRVFDAALNGDTIHGNVESHGGGAGLLNPETDFVPFSIKDDVIGGNLRVTGLTTVWFGVIRTVVHGNVVLERINLSDPDGNEVVTDHIYGNLVCRHMSPHPQLGDAIGDPNNSPSIVEGRSIGQCEHIS